MTEVTVLVKRAQKAAGERRKEEGDFYHLTAEELMAVSTTNNF